MTLRHACLIFLLAALVACQSDPEIVLIPDNTAPPDPTVSTVVTQTYVNKLYIGLLGRKPSDTELNAAVDALTSSELSEAARVSIIEDIQRDPTYYQRQYEVARQEILNNLDTSDVGLQIQIYTQLKRDPRYQEFIYFLDYEINRLEALRYAASMLIGRQIDRRELHRRFVNNLFYDEINMGSQNFVLAVYEYFLNRYPSEAEESAAIDMVDGLDAVVFNREGNSKDNFVEIFFESNAYLEGMVTQLYQRYLFRSPNSVEMAEATAYYRSTDQHEAVVQLILSKDEYVGL